MEDDLKQQKEILEKENCKLQNVIEEREKLTGVISAMRNKIDSRKRQFDESDDDSRSGKRLRGDIDIVAESARLSDIPVHPPSHIATVSQCKFLNLLNVFL